MIDPKTTIEEIENWFITKREDCPVKNKSGEVKFCETFIEAKEFLNQGKDDKNRN